MSYTIEALGEGSDVVDGHFAENWYLVLRDGVALRKFPTEADAVGYVQKQVRARAARNIGD
jgi:hypothetical protein